MEVHLKSMGRISACSDSIPNPLENNSTKKVRERKFNTSPHDPPAAAVD
jgi:hypothetical protein